MLFGRGGNEWQTRLEAVIPGFATRHAGVSTELDPCVDVCIGYAQLLQMLH